MEGEKRDNKTSLDKIGEYIDQVMPLFKISVIVFCIGVILYGLYSYGYLDKVMYHLGLSDSFQPISCRVGGGEWTMRKCSIFDICQNPDLPNCGCVEDYYCKK